MARRTTPTNAACAEFFAGAPVARVASYHSDAYSSTRQIADDGTEIAQKPLYYRVWLPGDETASTMTALAGGRVYLVYATDSWEKTFLGVPAAPQQTWRATSGETGFMNLVGVSAGTNASVTARAYFGEGPFGTASGTAYQIAGTKTAAPTFLSLGLASSPKVKGLCTQEASDAFCAKSAAALKSYLDKHVEEGVLTPAERKALGR